jgi:hypothetical protein
MTRFGIVVISLTLFTTLARAQEVPSTPMVTGATPVTVDYVVQNMRRLVGGNVCGVIVREKTGQQIGAYKQHCAIISAIDYSYGPEQTDLNGTPMIHTYWKFQYKDRWYPVVGYTWSSDYRDHLGNQGHPKPRKWVAVIEEEEGGGQYNLLIDGFMVAFR